MTVADFTDSYDRDGYCFRWMCWTGMKSRNSCRNFICQGACRGDETKLNAINQYPHLLLPQVYDLTKNDVSSMRSKGSWARICWCGVSLSSRKRIRKDRLLASGPDLLGSGQFGRDDLLGGADAGFGGQWLHEIHSGSQKQRILPHTDTFAEATCSAGDRKLPSRWMKMTR